MHYNEPKAIISYRESKAENLTVVYSLSVENKYGEKEYSIRIAARDESGAESEFVISRAAKNAESALLLFEKLYSNTVLPCEVEYIYSDGFEEFI